MSWKEFAALVFLIEVLVLISMLVWAIPTIIDGIIKTNRRNKFGKELSILYDKNKLNRQQVEIFAKGFYLNTKDIQLAARREFKESLTAEKLQRHRSSLLVPLHLMHPA